jgi:hypothetical protein
MIPARRDLERQGWHKVDADWVQLRQSQRLNQPLPPPPLEQILREHLERQALELEINGSEWIIRDPTWRPGPLIQPGLF